MMPAGIMVKQFNAMSYLGSSLEKKGLDKTTVWLLRIFFMVSNLIIFTLRNNFNFNL